MTPQTDPRKTAQINPADYTGASNILNNALALGRSAIKGAEKKFITDPAAEVAEEQKALVDTNMARLQTEIDAYKRAPDGMQLFEADLASGKFSTDALDERLGKGNYDTIKTLEMLQGADETIGKGQKERDTFNTAYTTRIEKEPRGKLEGTITNSNTSFELANAKLLVDESTLSEPTKNDLYKLIQDKDKQVLSNQAARNENIEKINTFNSDAETKRAEEYLMNLARNKAQGNKQAGIEYAKRVEAAGLKFIPGSNRIDVRVTDAEWEAYKRDNNLKFNDFEREEQERSAYTQPVEDQRLANAHKQVAKAIEQYEKDFTTPQELEKYLFENIGKGGLPEGVDEEMATNTVQKYKDTYNILNQLPTGLKQQAQSAIQGATADLQVELQGAQELLKSEQEIMQVRKDRYTRIKKMNDAEKKKEIRANIIELLEFTHPAADGKKGYDKNDVNELERQFHKELGYKSGVALSLDDVLYATEMARVDSNNPLADADLFTEELSGTIQDYDGGKTEGGDRKTRRDGTKDLNIRGGKLKLSQKASQRLTKELADVLEQANTVDALKRNILDINQAIQSTGLAVANEYSFKSGIFLPPSQQHTTVDKLVTPNN